MISLAEFDYRESRNSIDNLCDLAEMSSFKLYKRADMKNKASFKLFERRVQLMSRQQKGKQGGTISYLKSLGSSEKKEPLIT